MNYTHKTTPKFTPIFSLYGETVLDMYVSEEPIRLVHFVDNNSSIKPISYYGLRNYSHDKTLYLDRLKFLFNNSSLSSYKNNSNIMNVNDTITNININNLHSLKLIRGK